MAYTPRIASSGRKHKLNIPASERRDSHLLRDHDYINDTMVNRIAYHEVL